MAKRAARPVTAQSNSRARPGCPPCVPRGSGLASGWAASPTGNTGRAAHQPSQCKSIPRFRRVPTIHFPYHKFTNHISQMTNHQITFHKSQNPDGRDVTTTQVPQRRALYPREHGGIMLGQRHANKQVYSRTNRTKSDIIDHTGVHHYIRHCYAKT